MHGVIECEKYGQKYFHQIVLDLLDCQKNLVASPVKYEE